MKQNSGQRGRPPSDQRRMPMGLRVTPEMRDELVARAEAKGRSITQEMELLLEQALLTERMVAYPPEIAALTELIARVMNEVGQSIAGMNQVAGHGARSWLTDPYAYDQAVKGAIHILLMSRPPGQREPWGVCAAADFPSPQEIGKEIADGILETMRGRIDVPGALAKQWTPRIRDKLGVIAERLVEQPEPDSMWGPAYRMRGGKPVEIEE